MGVTHRGWNRVQACSESLTSRCSLSYMHSRLTLFLSLLIVSAANCGRSGRSDATPEGFGELTKPELLHFLGQPDGSNDNAVWYVLVYTNNMPPKIFIHFRDAHVVGSTITGN